MREGWGRLQSCFQLGCLSTTGQRMTLTELGRVHGASYRFHGDLGPPAIRLGHGAEILQKP